MPRPPATSAWTSSYNFSAVQASAFHHHCTSHHYSSVNNVLFSFRHDCFPCASCGGAAFSDVASRFLSGTMSTYMGGSTFMGGQSEAVFVESVLGKMRTMLKRRGADGVQGLARNFRICDTNGSGQLDEEELAKCFRLCKVQLHPDEAQAIFRAFDTSGNGTLSFEEFLRAIRGRMSPPRKILVTKVFQALDAAGDGNGTLTVDDIAPYFNTADHPAVKAGDKTEEQVLQEFLKGFEGRGGDHDGTVSLEEWLGYYEEMSAGIDEDDFFGGMIASTWSSLKTKSGEQAIQYVSEGDMNVLENILKKNIYQKSQVTARTRGRASTPAERAHRQSEHTGRASTRATTART